MLVCKMYDSVMSYAYIYIYLLYYMHIIYIYIHISRLPLRKATGVIEAIGFRVNFSSTLD